MKPFNLLKALAGEPVTTRAGAMVTHIAHFPGAYKVIFELEGDIHLVNEDGSFKAYHPSDWDLFMYEKPKVKVQRWVNIYRHSPVLITSNRDSLAVGGYSYLTKKDAEECSGSKAGTVLVEWEE